MELILLRDPSNDACTSGELYEQTENGHNETICFTLEDIIREIDGEPVEKWKIRGKTAIPQGRYEIFITESTRFRTALPILMDVPGFSGIRIHAGNTAADTEGCILVGGTRTVDRRAVRSSRVALNHLYQRIQNALDAGEQVWITISNPNNGA